MEAQEYSGSTMANAIRGNGNGWTFSAADFGRLAGRNTVDSGLHRLHKRGKIRRVMRGIYDYPRYSELLGQHLSPDPEMVARALARKFGWRIQLNGAAAQNLLGLSTQVPAKIVYLSDGPSRRYRVGATEISFVHLPAKEAGFKLRESSLIVQALKAFGKGRLTPEIVAKVRAWLKPELRAKVLADTRTATGWVYKAIREIAREDAQ